MENNKNPSSITQQLQVVFGISIVILLLSSYASFYSNRKLIDTSQLVNHTNDVIKNAELLISTVKDAETGQRGYIITNDPSFLQPYNGAYQRALETYHTLKVLTNDNPRQQQNIEAAKNIIDQRFDQMRRVLEISNSGTLSSRSSLFVTSHAEMDKGKKIMDELRQAVESIKSEEKQLLAKRTAQQETYIKYTPPLVVLAALVSIVISLLAYARIKKDLDERIKKQKEEQEKYIETNRRIAEMELVTRSLAEGELSTRSTDEAKDDLGRIGTALNLMANSLEGNFSELEKRNWLQNGMVTVNKTIRGERYIHPISGKIIDSVASYLNAQVGTLYIADNNLNLKLEGKYAVSSAPEELEAGEGMIGQAVKTQQTIISNELPANYLTIQSSIGKTTPVYAIVVPLTYAGNVIAVMELGLLRKPNELELSYLENITESLAIGIHTAINYERIQELLEETQAQSEELQAQHNELENINAELEAQTEKLQASEEELRVQQEELQQANHELEERSSMLEERNQLIVEKNLEVQRKAEELELSTKYKSEFLANMSHELRTPLNSILLLSRLLAENGTQNLNEDQVEYAKVIQSSGNGLLSLIDEILDLSKIEAGKMTLELEQVLVKEVTGDMRALFEPVARDKSIEFTIAVGEDVATEVETDKMRLEQVLKNLISNALKFTKHGSITLSVENNKSKKGFIDLSVTDTGIGIPEEKQRLIFEAFQQADGSTRRKYGGTGLGLSISKQLAKLLGGDISLQSTAGQGSTFTVSIPVSSAYRAEQITETEVSPALHIAQPITHEGPKTNGKYIATNIPENIPDDRAQTTNGDKSILIIEDDTNFAKSLLDFTRARGYKGIVSVRGDEGIELAKQFSPTGILLDVELPVKSGLQVMEELKSNPSTRHIPVHMMSSHSLKKESLLKGAINFIDKPMAFEQIQEVFNKLEHVLNRDSKKVLIVEDNPKHAKALAYFLETFNINSDIKNTISESVEALKNDTDCVILDMGIPDNKAYETLEQIKKNPGLETLPIIVFTGKSLSMAEEQRIKHYADSIVVKTAHSYQRILDEVSIFLHMVEENKNTPSRNSFKKTRRV